MKNKKIARRRALLLALSALLLLSGCGKDVAAAAAVDLTAGVRSNKVRELDDLTADAAAVTDFGVRLFQAVHTDGANTLISPFSVMNALAMNANGARGDTLAQMEATLGLGSETLNRWLHTYSSGLPRSKDASLHIANSIWFSDDTRLEAEQEFLQTNADYYGAELYAIPFGDSASVGEINDWVGRSTDGMIDSVISDIPVYAVMLVINALAFDAEWERPYHAENVRDGVFTMEDGTEQNARFMYSGEYMYLEDENAVGFLKYYKGGGYAFAALLPDEGVGVSDYIASLTGVRLRNILTSAEPATVSAALPKFSRQYLAELADILSVMGMPDAFDVGSADFSGIGSSPLGNIHISQVLHKTFIEVDELGTRAGAVTASAMNSGSSSAPTDVKYVYLDRPFVYMLIDCRTNVPLFIGALMSAA